MYQPYTYLIAWTHLNTFYYGVRYSKSIEGKTPEQDLWISYFTSSHHVQKFREDHGEPDRVEIRRVFDSAEKARQWEEKFLKRIDVLEKDNWLNCSYPNKNFYTSIVSEETRKKLSLALKGKSFNDAHRTKISKNMKGNKNNERKRWYNNGSKEIMLNPLIDQIPDGYVLGRIETMKTPKGKKYYNNGTREIMIDPNVSEIPEGFVLGRTKKKYSDRAKKTRSKIMKGRKWFTNGEKSIMLNPSDPIPVGFRPGRK